jgi:predicted negative regulator of RcsB-dependent stress response
MEIGKQSDMSTLDLEEQEQLATLKAWWNQYGNLVILAVSIVLLAFAGWNGWNWYRGSRALEAASLYETLQKAARANDLKAARDATGTILEKYSGTAYGPLAALVSAKMHFQSGDLKTARAQLQWISDSSASDELKSVARLRLANVLLDDSAPDEALKVLSAKPPAGFEALFDSMRGDVLLVQKKNNEAREAYQSALGKAGKADPGLTEQLRRKIDALGGA